MGVIRDQQLKVIVVGSGYMAMPLVALLAQHDEVSTLTFTIKRIDLMANSKVVLSQNIL